jgi:hypothetical protein
MDDRRAFVFGSESAQAFLRHFGLESELFYWLREMAILGRRAHWNLAVDNHRLIPIGQTTSIRPWKSDPDIVLTAATAHECAGLLYSAVFEVVFPEAPEFEDEAAVDDWLVSHKAEIANRTSGIIEKSDYSAMLGLAAAVERERILALSAWPRGKGRAETAEPRGKRGRPAPSDDDVEKDKRIWDHFKQSQDKRSTQMALSITQDEFNKAIERHRWRLRKGKQQPARSKTKRTRAR